MKSIIFTILVFFSGVCHGAVIGKVFDATDAQWLATVKVMNRVSGTIVYTNEQGAFSLSADVGDMLEFSSPGFESVIKEVPLTKLMYIQLQPNQFKGTGSLQSMLSTTGKHAQSLSSIPASAVIVTQEEIRQFGYQSVFEILNHVSGLYLIEEYSWTGTDANIGVRGYLSGSSNNSVMIMINGVSQYEEYWGQFPLSQIDVPVHAIKRVEVVRGPMSVTYGNQALMGTINIITRSRGEHSKKKSSDFFSWSRTTYSDVSIAAQLNYEGKADHMLTLGWSKKPGRFNINSLNPDMSFSSDYDGVTSSQNLYVGISSNIRNNLVMNANFAQSKKGILANLDDISNSPFPQTGRQSNSIDSGNISLKYSLPLLKDKTVANFAFGYSASTAYQNYFEGNAAYGVASDRSKAIQIELGWSFDGQLLWELPLNFSVGSQYRQVFGLQSSVDIGDAFYKDAFFTLADGDSIDAYSVLFNLDYQLSDNWRVDLGLRGESTSGYDLLYGCNGENTGICSFDTGFSQTKSKHIPRFKMDYTSRLALIYENNDSSVVKVIYGTSARNPSLGQNADIIALYANELISAIPEPFKKEEMSSLELIAIKQLAGKENNWSLNTKLAVFRNQFDNALVKEWLLTFPRQAEIKGVEFAADFQWERFLVKASLNYYDAEYRQDNYHSTLPPPLSPSVLGSLKLGLNLDRRSTASLSIRYIDELYNPPSCIDKTYFVIKACAYNKGAPKSTADAWIADVTFNRESLFNTSVDAQVGIKNILKKGRRYPISGTNRWLKRGFPADQRLAFINFQYRF